MRRQLPSETCSEDGFRIRYLMVGTTYQLTWYTPSPSNASLANRMERTEDDATLQAVVAFIDDYYASGTTSSEVSMSSEDTTTSCSGHDGIKPKGGRAGLMRHLNHNRGRDREKRELLSLRQEEKALREHLLQLARVKKRARCVGMSKNDGRSMTMRVEMLSAWKETASRQRERRRRSEDENSRLRERVVDQREVIRSLQRILERQLAESNTNDPMSSSRLHMPPWRAVCAGGDPCRMMRIFAELTADLKQVRASTDTWVQVSPPSLLSAGRFINTRIVPLSPTSLAVETVNLRLMPFAFDAVGGTYWLQCVNSHCLNYDYYREKADVEGRETVFCGQAFHDVVADHVPTNVRLRTQLSIQNFEEDSRMLVVSSARSESVNIGDQELRGTKLKEQYWNVFQPPEPNEHDACLMMSFGRVTMDFETGVSKSPLAVLTLTKYFGGRLHQQLDDAVAMIEDKLLENCTFQTD